MGPWPKGIGAITLFGEDLEAAKRFYREVFGLPVTFEDDASAVFDFGNTLINLLKTTAARELMSPRWSQRARPDPAFSSPSSRMTWMRCARNRRRAGWC
jgi:catechol 2,3-dioxygenase-like lactoylglutathione lyase family enzyme